MPSVDRSSQFIPAAFAERILRSLCTEELDAKQTSQSPTECSLGYHWQHEPCWYAVRAKGNWTGDRKQTTLWTISAKDQDAKTEHATQKPVECMRRPMLNNSSPGQAVYDPFVDYVLSDVGQKAVAGVELMPARTDVKADRPLIGDLTLLKTSTDEAARKEVLTHFASIFGTK